MIGTGPMHPIAGTLGIPTVSPAGVAHPGSKLHAPNENIRLDDYKAGIKHVIEVMAAMGDTR
jgi:acetylornithine deacetylase/succinyl-diaminopimelate desuccinylase-like protein